jgi:hypothetical protein
MSRALVQATWEDAAHLTREQKDSLWASIPAYQRDARTKGIPQLGSGAIYPVEESDLVVPMFKIPDWFRLSYGLDVGWNRTAAIWSALDPETDVLYFYSEHYRGQAEPAVHAQAIRGRGEWIPGVIDPAANGRSQIDGDQLITMYNDLGLHLVKADNSVEAGIYEVFSRMSSGRLKIFETLVNLRAELRIYRRDEKGKIVKENDHAMDAMRYDVMSGLRVAVSRPPAEWAVRKAAGHKTDFDPFAQGWVA